MSKKSYFEQDMKELVKYLQNKDIEGFKKLVSRMYDSMGECQSISRKHYVTCIDNVCQSIAGKSLQKIITWGF